MGALIGLAFGAGALLMLASFTERPTGPRKRVDRREGRLRQLLASAGVEGVSPAQVVALCAVAFALASFVMLGISGVIAVGAVFGLMAAWVPIAVLRGRAARRRREHAALWPDVVDNLSSAVRAGLSLPEALTQLGERGPDGLRAPFMQFGRDYQSTGRFHESLDLLKTGWPIRSVIGWSRRFASPERSAAATWARCFERCRASCVTTFVRAVSWNRGSPGRSTELGSPWRRHGWCCSS